MIDACGSAGGRHPGQGTGGAGAQFQNSSLAKQGDKGSELPPLPSRVTWRAGSVVEAGWTVSTRHTRSEPLPSRLPRLAFPSGAAVEMLPIGVVVAGPTPAVPSFT